MRLTDLQNGNFRNPQSKLIANQVLSVINERNKSSVSKDKWKSINQLIADSDQMISALEAKAGGEA